MQQVFLNIQNYVAAISLIKLKKMIKYENINYHLLASGIDFKNIKHSMAIIRVSNKHLEITIKIHYSPDTVKEFFSQIRKCEKNSISEEEVNDFTKELCNVIGGKLQRPFADKDFHLDLGIPWITRGVDEIFYSFDPEKQLISCWEFYPEKKKGENLFVLHLVIESNSDEIFKKTLDLEVEKDTESGSLEEL